MTLSAWLRSFNVLARLRAVEEVARVGKLVAHNAHARCQALESGRTTHDRRLALLEKRRRVTKKGGRK